MLHLSLLHHLVEELVHGLVSQLNTKEGGGVGGHGTGQGGTEAGEEGLVTSLAVQLPDDTAERDVALSRLQAGFDCVDGEDGDPHGNTSSGTGAGDGCETQLAAGLSGVGVDGSELALDVLVRGEVGGRTRTVTGEGGGTTTEDTAHASLAVQLLDDVEAAAVLGLLAGGELLLALDLEDDLDALKGGRDGRHGDGREEAGGRGLRDGEPLGGDLADASDDLLAEVVTPEGDGDCGEYKVSSLSTGNGTRCGNRLSDLGLRD